MSLGTADTGKTKEVSRIRRFFVTAKKAAVGFFRDFWAFLKNVWLLFSRNFKEVMLFILFSGAVTVAATSLLKNGLLWLMMKVSGTTYIVPANMKAVFLNPVSILLMLLFAVTVTFLSLFEIAGLLHAFSMSQIGRQTNLVSMFLAGLRACKKALHPKNWLLLLFILVLFPLLKVFPLAGSTFKLVLPGFVNQTIAYTKTLRIVYWAFYLSLIAFLTIYIFSVNIFVLQKSDFRKSCSRSRRLGRGHYVETLLTMALLTLLLNVLINSAASVLVMNVRETAALFQRNSGVVSKSAEIGTYIYVLRQILKGFIAPAVNNAALTVLFYRYIEEKEILTALSKDTFRMTKTSRRTVAVFLAVVLALFAADSVFLVRKYSFLKEGVDRPVVCAYRGDNVHAPENTMPAFELAASENLPWIEVDVHQTSDNIIVCNHDSTINRVTGFNLAIHDTTFAELTSHEMGPWMPGDYEFTMIPTLEEVLKMAQREGMRVQVELKGHPDDVNFEENVLDVINRTGMHDNVMIIAQDAERMKRIDELDPAITKGYCMFLALGNLEDIEFTDNVSIEVTNVTPELVKRMHEEGKMVFCWTVDREDTIQYLVNCGVDVIGTDNPMMVTNALEEVDYSGGIARAFHIFMHAIADMDQ